MSGIVSISVSSNAAEIVRQLQAFPPAMLESIRKALDLQNELTVGHVQATKLSQRGPDTLGVVTNRLRSSLRPTAAVVSGQSVASSIGTPVRYAGAHEDGFVGEVQVRAFTRRVTSAFGRRMPSGTTASVSPHKRKVTIRARRWLSRGIEERVPAYGQAVSAAIVAAWEGVR